MSVHIYTFFYGLDRDWTWVHSGHIRFWPWWNMVQLTFNLIVLLITWSGVVPFLFWLRLYTLYQQIYHAVFAFVLCEKDEMREVSSAWKSTVNNIYIEDKLYECSLHWSILGLFTSSEISSCRWHLSSLTSTKIVYSVQVQMTKEYDPRLLSVEINHKPKDKSTKRRKCESRKFMIRIC